MDVPKEIYYINFKVQLVAFKVVPFAIYALVPGVLSTSEANLGIFLQLSFVPASNSGIVSKRFPVIANLISENSQKSQSAMFGEYGG